MSKDKRPPQTHEIEIDAPPEAVWNAISTGECVATTNWAPSRTASWMIRSS